MGNRAFVVFADELDGQGTREILNFSPAIYLHWNGGPESIYTFLDELVERGGVFNGVDYAAARFVQIVGEFFMPSQNSLGIQRFNSSGRFYGLAEHAGSAENGVYLVQVTWKKDCPYKVRRLVCSPDSGAVGWLAEDGVAAERERVASHPYNNQPAGQKPADHLRKIREAIIAVNKLESGEAVA